MPLGSPRSDAEINGEPFSSRDFTGSSFVPVISNSSIKDSCFSQESPGRRIFPDDIIGVTFTNCNLDNVYLPAGATAINCSQRRFKAQVDGRDWIVDEENHPILPLDLETAIRFGLNIDPTKITS